MGTKPDADHVRMTAQVQGYVQGVGFRWTTMSVAKPLGLLGYAENLPNGDVEVVAEGTVAACLALLEWLNGKGSRGVRLPGRVDSLDSDWGPAVGGLRSFSIRG